MYPVSKETTGADIRQYIANHTLALNEQFHVDSIQSLMEKRADFFDKLLIALWCSFELNHSTLSINAVGGYGRKRLHPQSDIDLAIISERKILLQLIQSLLVCDFLLSFYMLLFHHLCMHYYLYYS